MGPETGRLPKWFRHETEWKTTTYIQETIAARLRSGQEDAMHATMPAISTLAFPGFLPSLKPLGCTRNLPFHGSEPWLGRLRFEKRPTSRDLI